MKFATKTGAVYTYKCNSRVTQEITWNHASNKNISWDCEECVTTCREQWKKSFRIVTE